MRHWFDRRQLIWLALFIGLFVGILLLATRPSAALNSWKTTMSARGERFGYTELAPTFSMTAVDWEATLSNQVTRLVGWPHHPSLLQLMSTDGRGKAFLAWARTDPMGARTPEDFWPKFVAQMEANEPVLADIENLLAARPLGSLHNPRNLVKSAPGNPYAVRRQVVQFLVGTSISSLRQQKIERALEHLGALVDFADASKVDSRLLDHMLNAAIAGLGLSLTWETWHAPGLTDAHLEKLAEGWQRVNLITNLARVAETERAFGLACMAFARTNETGISGLATGPGTGPKPITDQFRDAVVNRLWRSAWSKRDEFLFLRVLQPIVESLRAARTNVAYHQVRLRGQESTFILDRETHGTFGKLRHSSAVLLLPNWAKAIPSVWKNESFRRVTLCALALKRYQLRQGHWPEDLLSLIPDFLPAEITDPMSGRPLVYRRLAGAEFMLYSVGPNAEDDGGVGDDIVWPRLAPSEAPDAPRLQQGASPRHSGGK